MEHFNFALFMVLVALQIGDWITTKRALATNNQTKEGNPVMAWAFAHIGFVPSMLIKLTLVIAGGLYLGIKGGVAGTITLVCLVALYSWVVWHNSRLIK